MGELEGKLERLERAANLYRNRGTLDTEYYRKHAEAVERSDDLADCAKEVAAALSEWSARVKEREAAIADVEAHIERIKKAYAAALAKGEAKFKKIMQEADNTEFRLKTEKEALEKQVEVLEERAAELKEDKSELHEKFGRLGTSLRVLVDHLKAKEHPNEEQPKETPTPIEEAKEEASEVEDFEEEG